MNTRRLGIGAALGGLCITVIMQTFVSNSAPQILHDLRGSLDSFGWIFSVYMLATAVSIPVSGQLIDRFNARLVLLAGVGVFSVASLLCAISGSMEQLIFFRLVQGLGAALASIASLAVIPEIVDENQTAKLYGIANACQIGSYLAGPILGGVLTQMWGWRLAFVSIVAIGIVTSILVLLGVPGPKAQPCEQKPGGGKLDLIGPILMGGATCTTLAAMDGWANQHLTALTSAALLGGALLTLYLFARFEAAHPNPMLPKALIRSSTYRFALLNCLLVGTMQYSAVAFIPVLVQTVRLGSVLDCAYFVVPMVIGGMASSVLGGRLNARMNTTTISVIGLTTVGAGYLLLAVLGASKHDWPLQCASLLVGVGIALYYPSQLEIAKREGGGSRGIALGLVNASRNIGGALSVGMLSMLLAANPAAPGERLAIVFFCLSAFAVLGGAFNAVFSQARPNFNPSNGGPTL